MPQALGTMLALLGAFYPARDGSLKKEIIELQSGLKRKIQDSNRLNQLFLWYANRATRLSSVVGMGPSEIRDLRREFEKLTLSEKEFIESLTQFANATYSEVEISKLKNDLSSIQMKFIKAETYFHTRYDPVVNQYLDHYDDDNEKNRKKHEVDFRFGNDLIREIMSEISMTQRRISLLNSIKKNIKNLFVFNGIVVILFIISFVFLSKTASSYCLHMVFLISGVVLASLSVYSLVYYVYNTVTERVQISLFGIRLRETKIYRRLEFFFEKIMSKEKTRD